MALHFYGKLTVGKLKSYLLSYSFVLNRDSLYISMNISRRYHVALAASEVSFN
jgi:hypothetical protein